jgi:hypothetical protein
MASVTPASSSSQSRILFMLCPPARAALISGQSARIWPALVAGFSARRSARRSLTGPIQFAGFGGLLVSDKRASTYKGSECRLWTQDLAASPALGVIQYACDDLRQITTTCDKLRLFATVTTICDKSRRSATTEQPIPHEKKAKNTGSGT